MKGQYRKDRPHEFTIAYWRTVDEAERLYGVAIKLCALNSSHVGFITFDLAARALEDGPEAPPLARVTELWPNAHEQPFEVFMYQMAFKLSAMVEMARKERRKGARR